MKIQKLTYFFWCFLLLLPATLKAEEYPLTLSCTGRGTSGEVHMSLNFKNFLVGSGSLDSTPIVFVDTLDGGENSYSLFGWPKSQDTGNPNDIKHKIEIVLDRYSGNFSLSVTSVTTRITTGRASGHEGVQDFV